MASTSTSRSTARRSAKSDADKVHGRLNDLTSRVVKLEAQGPHIEAMFARIERSVDGIKEMLSRVVWVVVLAFVAALLKLVLPGIGQ